VTGRSSSMKHTKAAAVEKHIVTVDFDTIIGHKNVRRYSLCDARLDTRAALNAHAHTGVGGGVAGRAY